MNEFNKYKYTVIILKAKFYKRKECNDTDHVT